MNKKNLFLIILPIFGFILFITVHYFFLDVINKFQQNATNLETKQIIFSDINHEIIKTKALFFQIPLLSDNKRSLNYNIKLLKQSLSTQRHLLNILKYGGVYKKNIPLNIVNKNNFKENYFYHKDEELIESINLLSKISFLEKKMIILQKILTDFYTTEKMNNAQLIKKRKKLIRFSKSLDSVFRRMAEDSNKLFYENQTSLTKLKKDLKERTVLYKKLEFGLILFLILIYIFIGYTVIKKLTILNRKLNKKLYTDELTNTYSRRKLEETTFGKNSVLILVDIDGFRDINELYGRKTGDKLLQFVVNRLKTYNKNWEVFRLSSDVFGLYLNDANKMSVSIEEKIKSIEKHLILHSIQVEDNTIDISITVGVAFGKNLLHESFVALSIAKDENLAYSIFHDEKEFIKIVEFNKLWQKEIKYAIQEDRIKPFFQPIVDKNRNIVKYECLMRMKKIEDNKIKYIPPFFLDVAMKTKQYLILSKIMIEKTFIDFKDGGEFSINLNNTDMTNLGTKKFLEDLIINYNAKNRVTFEILESEGTKDYQVIKNFLNYFRQYGVKIAIDDFGSGYSNLRRIMTLKPDYIKFDGSLIKNIDMDSNAYALVESMVQYAKKLNIKTLAEFVHNEDIFNKCLELNIDYFQGYYFSEPKENIDLNARAY